MSNNAENVASSRLAARSATGGEDTRAARSATGGEDTRAARSATGSDNSRSLSERSETKGPPKRSPDELRALAEAGNIELGSLTDHEASASEVAAWVARNFAVDAVSVACSMADAVLPFIAAEHLPGVDVLFLDTGYHFTETYATRDEVARVLDVNIVDVKPKQTVAEQDAAYGKDLFARDPATCCDLRKVQPLHDILSGYELWFTGVRRDEAPTRTNTPLVTYDEKNGLVKVNPVAAWSFDELQAFAAEHKVPVNLLVNFGYPSIGCQPCTKPVAAGEDPRSGRWAGSSKTECGLHV